MIRPTPPVRTAAPVLAAALACLLWTPAATAGPLLIYSLGNEGFQITSEHHSVLIDALYTGLDGYPAPDAAELKRRADAAPPFDLAKLVLATHHHGDHFDPAVVARYLVRNPKAVFVSSPTAVQMLEEAAPDGVDLAGRLTAARPAEGEKVAVPGTPVPLVAMNLHHGRERKPPVENLGFLVELDGARVLHMGDTEMDPRELAELDLASENITVAFVPFWHLLGPVAVAAMQEALGRSTTLVAMHLPTADAPAAYFGRPDNLADLTLELRKAGVIVLEPGKELRLTSDR